MGAPESNTGYTEEIEERTHEHHPHFFANIFPIIYCHDDVDFPNTPCISNLDIFLIIGSIIMHIVDMVIDYNMAIQYLRNDKLIYFILTLIFILGPSLINVIISKRMQHQDKEVLKQIHSNSETLDGQKTSHLRITKILYFVITVIMQLAPVIQYCETLKYALKSRNCEKSGDRAGEKQYYIKMLKKDQDIALLRVLECFLEAAPQQILQLTLLLKEYHSETNFVFIHQVINITISFVSMGWTMAIYHRSIRLAQQDKQNISIVGTTALFLFHIFITVARILSIGFFASIWPIPTVITCTIHWISMTIWIFVDSHGISNFCRNYNRPPHMQPKLKERIYSVLFAAVIGIVHTFIYFNIVDNSTFWKHVVFYIICFLENTAFNICWRHTLLPKVQNVFLDVFCVVCVSFFFLGIIIMIIYYNKFHPTKKERNFNNINTTLQPI